MILLRPICWLFGHKRGRPVGEIVAGNLVTPIRRVFACPRCGRETRYKVKPSTGTPT